MDRIKGLLKQLPSLLYKHKFTILCALFFFIISWKYINFFYNKGVLIIASVSLIFIMHLASKWRFHIVFTILFSAIIALNCYFAFVLKTNVTSGLLGSIIDTDAGEIKSMSGAILVEGTLCFLISFAFIFLAMRELRKSTIPAKYSAIGLALYLFVYAPFQVYKFFYIQPNKGTLNTELPEYPLVVAEMIGYEKAPVFYGNIITLMNYVKDNIAYKNMINAESKILPEGVTLHTDVDSLHLPQRIYLLVGESATRDHMSVYGYPKPTTPFFDSIAAANEGFNYYQGYTAATITRDALRQTLTFSTPHNMDAFLESKSIIDMANDAGYETTWIANRYQIKKTGSGLYISLIALSANEVLYTDGVDDLLLEEKARGLVDTNKKQFILLQMNGSHEDYNDKYDQLDIDALPMDDALSDQENHYNRSLHHTDRFIQNVYKNIIKQDSSAVFIYYSDHGDVVGVGHGMKYGRQQLRVPLVIHNNAKVNLDAIVDKYKFNYQDEEVLCNMSTFNILAELMGYKFSDEQVKLAVEESKYVYYTDKTVGTLDSMRDKAEDR